MNPWHEAIPSLKEALAGHFLNADDSEIEKWADEIYNGGSAAASLERLERGDKPPKKDIENLKSAIQHLKISAKKLEQSGWHGNKSLLEFAKEVKKMKDNFPGSPLMGVMDASGYLAGFMRGLAGRLGECADEIDPQGVAVMTAFGDDSVRRSGPGRRSKTEAYFTAREAYNAFAAFTGTTPSVTTNTLDNTATGPFLEFVEDVFKCMRVEASAETWARVVCREKNGTRA